MPFAALSWRTVNTVLLTYEGRDKTARFFQFAGRAVMGFTAGAKKGYLRSLNFLAQRLMVSISGSRRSFRWGREVPVLLEIPRALELQDPVDRALDLGAKVTILLFFWTDHVGWFYQVRGGMRSGAGTIQRGLKFLTLSSVIAAVFFVRKLRALRAEERASGRDTAEQQHDCVLRAWRNALLAVQVAHLSRLWVTHDAIVGPLGMVTSALDVLFAWPKEAPKVATPDS